MKLTKTNLEITYDLANGYLSEARDELAAINPKGLSQEIALKVAVDALDFTIVSIEENKADNHHDTIEIAIEDFINDTYTDY